MNRPAAWLLGSRKSSSRKLFGVALMAASALRVIRLLAIVGRESMMLIGVMTCDKPSMMTWPPPNRTSAWYRALRNKPARSLSVRVASLPSMRLRKSKPPQSPGDGAGGVRSGLTPMPVVSWIEVTMTLLSGIPNNCNVPPLRLTETVELPTLTLDRPILMIAPASIITLTFLGTSNVVPSAKAWPSRLNPIS